MAVAQYSAKLYINARVSTAYGGAEPCTLVRGVDPNRVYQITNAAKRCIDPDTTLTLRKDAGALVEGTDYTVDRLHGKFYMTHTVGAGVITVDTASKYFTLIEVTEVEEWAFDGEFETIKDTNMSDGGHESSIAGMKDGNMTFKVLDDQRVIHEGATTFKTLFSGRSDIAFIMDVVAGGSVRLGMWGQLSKKSLQAAMAGQVESPFTVVLNTKGKGALYSYSDE